MPPPKKTAKKPAKEEITEPSNRDIGEHDVVLDFKLTLKTRSGEPVDVEGTIPFSNALVPAFIADTQQSVQKLVQTIVHDRFLLQARHFFNQKREASIPKVETQPLLEQRDSQPPAYAPAADSPDKAFEFEEQEPNES